jgi:hypothetical protein
MIRTKTNGSMLSLLYRPLCVVLLLLGLFGLIRLRSNVVAVNYDIRNLEEKKTEAISNMKLLLAERSKYASLEKVAASFESDIRGGEVSNAAGDNLFGNRVRVIHIMKNKGLQPYRASLDEAVRK